MAAVTLIVTLSATGASAAVSERTSANSAVEARKSVVDRAEDVRYETCLDARLSQGGDACGAREIGSAARTALNHLRVTRPACADARRGLAYYIRRTNEWRHRMDAPVHNGTETQEAHLRAMACGRIRRAAKRWRSRAQRARLAYEAWSYQWEWQRWLPALWRAIGLCETGLNWHHNSGTYQGAFGFYYGTWDAYKPRGAPSEAYQATPRQQYQAALNVVARVGLGGWGCYSHGGYRYHMP